jgi:hypothetical protein
LDIVVTLGHNLGKYLAGFISGVGCQVFHGISELLQSQPPMQMSDCLRSTQQQPTVPAIRQRPECRKQNVSFLLTREFGKISQCPDLLHSSGHSVLSGWIPLVKSGTGKKARPSIIPQNTLKSSSFLQRGTKASCCICRHDVCVRW